MRALCFEGAVDAVEGKRMSSEGWEDEKNERKEKVEKPSEATAGVSCVCVGGAEEAEPTSGFMLAFAGVFASTLGVCLCALGEPLIVY